MKFSKFKERKGITLIALVITIIVLLILAGVTIAMVVGDNGILKRSNEAKEETKIAKIQEEIDLLCAQYRMDYETNNYRTSDASSDKKIQAMNEILVAYNESDVIVDTGDESSYTSDGSDENITAGTPGAYVANQLSTAKKRNETKYEIKFEGRKITVKDLDEDLSTWGVMEDSGRIIWNGKYVAGSGANSSGNSSSSSGESSGSENSGGSSSESGNNSTNEPRDTTVESALTEKLSSSTASERLIEVSYNPQGTYSWNKELATSDQTGTDTLSSGEGGSFNVNTWRVLDVDTTTGTVRLVPKNYASGEVRFHGAQGYNNAVKLLNDACSALYSDSDVGATARSINMNDIEDIMDDNITLPTVATAPTQPYSAYRSSESIYPVIYGNENLAVINGGDAISNGLDLSQQTSFIRRAEGTSETNTMSGDRNGVGAIITATSIRPYHTYYYKDNSSFKTALGNKSGIILPNGRSTNYWVASRCVYTDSISCKFEVCLVYSGTLNANNIFTSSRQPHRRLACSFPRSFSKLWTP